MSLAKTLLIPCLRVATVATPIHRAVLQVIVALVVSFHKAVATNARTTALHAIKATKRDRVHAFRHYFGADRTLAGVFDWIRPCEEIHSSDVLELK